MKQKAREVAFRSAVSILAREGRTPYEAGMGELSKDGLWLSVHSIETNRDGKPRTVCVDAGGVEF